MRRFTIHAGVLILIAAWGVCANNLANAQDYNFFRSKTNGKIIFVTAASVSSPQGSAATAKKIKVAAASAKSPAIDSFTLNHASAFGVLRPTKELVKEQEGADSLKFGHIRYRQVRRGVPVYGSDISVHMLPDGSFSSASGTIAKLPHFSTRGGLSKSQAVARAKSLFKAEFPAVKDAAIYRAEKTIYSPSLIQNTTASDASFAWLVEVSAPTQGVSRTYFINARTGEPLFKLQNEMGLNRKIYDCSAQPGTNTCWSQLYDAGLNYTFGRRESMPVRGPNPRYLPGKVCTDVDDAYEMMGQIHNYYSMRFGYNGVNNLGGTGDGVSVAYDLTTAGLYTNYLSSWSASCPYYAQNYHGEVDVCQGLATNDVIGHEYSHGIDFFSHWSGGQPVGITYYGESGALAEGRADFFAETFKHYMTGTNNWMMGVSSSGPYWRDLANPPSIVDSTGVPFPDRFNSNIFYCGGNDNGGVHVNSTVVGKATYLASVGGLFNGCTISPIGMDKMEQIAFRAYTQYFGVNESFNGAFYKLGQACQDLYGGETNTCNNLKRALQAVEMNQAGTCSGLPASVPDCIDLEGF